MDNTYAILHVLRDDLSWLGEIVAGAGMVMFVPALVVGFFAAASADPTLWRDLPVGIFRCWLAGSVSAVVLILVGLGFYGLVEQEISPDQRTILGWGTIGWSVCGFMVCLAVQFRAATRYFRWRIKKRLGWKIDEPAPQPANRWYSFSLRNLLLVQLAVVFAFGLWVSSRRSHIQSRQERLQTEAWQADLRERLGDHGWEVRHLYWPLRLESNGRPLYDFRNEVLDRILLSDDVRHLEVISDNLTDEGIKKIMIHQNLETLRLHSQKLTDAAVSQLKQLPKLQRVEISSAQLTDNGLNELQTMASLRSVTIREASISREAVAKFQESRPDVHVWVLTPHEESPNR